MSERSTAPEGLRWGTYGKLDHVPPGERTIEGLRDQFLLFASREYASRSRAIRSDFLSTT